VGAESPKEECGLFGIWAPGEEVARLTYFGLFAQQHRGQESAGIAVSDGQNVFKLEDADGAVGNVNTEGLVTSRDVRSLVQELALGLRVVSDPMAGVDPPPPAMSHEYKDAGLQRASKIGLPIFLGGFLLAMAFLVSNFWVGLLTNGFYIGRNEVRLAQAFTDGPAVSTDDWRLQVDGLVERPLTLFLNAQEIVTMMTIGDYPEYLALGYLLNQNMLKYDDIVTEVEYDDDLQVVVVRTEHHTNFEQKLRKRTQTSGCAQGTAFGDLLEAIESVALPPAELRTSWLYQMTHAINTMPSLYLEAGAIHGCVLCQHGTPVCYTEDVGRHNAVDKIAGWIYRHGVDPADKILYTTGRLTSEMVIKTVRMGIPILVSRSGFTAWGVDLARQVGLTLVGRARGKRFIALSGGQRIVYDQNLAFVEEESARHTRKGEHRDE